MCSIGQLRINRSGPNFTIPDHFWQWGWGIFLEVSNNDSAENMAGSEDQFSFMTSDEFNDDVDKFYFDRDNFDQSFFDDKEPESAFASLESDFGGALNRRQDFEEEEEEARPFSGERKLKLRSSLRS